MRGLWNPRTTAEGVKRILSAAIVAIVLVLIDGGSAMGQQVSIPRVELMPQFPSPYLMRDWKGVALGYDSLVYSLTASGTYLPLIWLNTSTVNYPGETSFGLNTYVGTNYSSLTEAINVLPSVVGATLCGVDKSSQGGTNWVKMCREYFANRAEEDVYLNTPTSSSGDDWWYDTMPNVFFYQLASLYPSTADFDTQFQSVADRWLAAVKVLGGSTTPWSAASTNYRAFALSTMTAYAGDVKEPESAGAMAWLLYMAYRQTGERKYREGAEQCMEYLSGLTSNPSYELQLSYGAYLAARMNAELGTTYDTEKIVNWCFDVGPLRSWGAMVGTWGGLDCSGLIGEVNGTNDYAFFMNTCEQVGALVPMVRYDARFARAMGRWVLNAANASRLFYPACLPDSCQDSRAWSQVYDPQSVIAHEALRQKLNSVSPYATGDAINGGWAATNLALYGSSHVGLLGAIVDTSDVTGILVLDMLKTDFYRQSAFPTYLLYNPYATSKTVTLPKVTATSDLYDAASHQFVARGVSGAPQIDIAADSAVVVVVVPAGGTVAYRGKAMLVDSVVVDFAAVTNPGNLPPRLKGLGALPNPGYKDGTVALYATPVDPDNDSVTVTWSADSGSVTGGSARGTWYVPSTSGTYVIRCTAADSSGNSIGDSLLIPVVDSAAIPPVVEKTWAHPGKLDLGKATVLTCRAEDTTGRTISFQWSSSSGSLVASESTAVWTAPDTAGDFWIHCTVTNSIGGVAHDSVGVEVRDFSQIATGSLLAWYPFDGDLADASGRGNTGSYSGSGYAYVADRFGTASHAISLNGTSAAVEIPNQPYLNSTGPISVSFWFQPEVFYDREQYPISHGNYTQRWKASISGKKLRWTVKTSNGVRDLDSRTSLVLKTYHHAVLVYSGQEMEIYLDGDLDAFTSWSGTLDSASVDLMIGQVLPGVTTWNYRGEIDDVRMFDYVLLPSEVSDLYGTTGVGTNPQADVPHEVMLRQNYPNPFNPTTTIGFGLPARSRVSLRVTNLLGQEVCTLFNDVASPGWHSVQWNAQGFASGCYFITLSTGQVRTTVRAVLLR